MICLNSVTPDIKLILEKELARLGGIKVNIVLTAQLEKMGINDQDLYEGNKIQSKIQSTAYFLSNAMTIIQSDEIDQTISKCKATIQNTLKTIHVKDLDGH